MTQKRVPDHVIPELPETVRPFTEKELLVQTKTVHVGDLDLDVIFEDRITVQESLDRLRKVFGEMISETGPRTPELTLMPRYEGEYDDSHTVYGVGYTTEETEDQMRERLETSKMYKLRNLDAKQKRQTVRAAERARIAAIREQTAEAELELVRTLAAKHGIKIEPAS
jgi:tetrahydromethanopterin S-methyltransferase subunit B